MARAQLKGGDPGRSQSLVRVPWLLAVAALKIAVRELDARLVRKLGSDPNT